MKKVVIYTDGACRGNPGIGGWAAVLHYNGHSKDVYGAVESTTNNRMELTAAIKALQALKSGCAVEIFTDSQYLRSGITEWIHGWKKKGWKNSKNQPVKNADLWQQLDELAGQHKINWHWVKAHNGDVNNEKADALANKAIDERIKTI